MNYSKRRNPSGDHRGRVVRITVIAVIISLAVGGSVFAITSWLGPFPFGISRRDTAMLTSWNDGEYDRVLTDAESVLVDQPLDAQALTFGGFAHFYVGIDVASADERREHLQRSIVLLRKAEHLPRAPLEGERRYVLAKAYYHTSDLYYDLCGKYMEAAIEDGYVADDSYSYLGLAYEGMGDALAGAAWFERGLLVSDTPALRAKAAEARIAAGDLDVAEEHLRRALAENDDGYLDLILQVRLASVLILRGDLDAAEAMLSTIVEEHPESADAVYYLGVVYQQTDRPVEARSMWRLARAIDPNHLKALESLANREE